MVFIMEVQKPITVARAEFIANLTSLINDSGLMPFIIEPILKDMLNDVRMVAQKQFEQDTALYHESLVQAEQEEPQCGD